MGKAKKFVGPSKRMAEALENEGLSVDWPETIEGEEDLAIEATFCTGMDWEKCVTIDLRYEGELKTKSDVDRAIANQLDEAYENFSVDDEMYECLTMPAREREARGMPDTDRLHEDKEEQEKRLKRFSDVADAVANGKKVPPAPMEYAEAEEGEEIHLTPDMAEGDSRMSQVYLSDTGLRCPKRLPPLHRHPQQQVGGAMRFSRNDKAGGRAARKKTKGERHE